MVETKVINFCAGPSAGKTTNALGLASHLKRMRKDVLYIPEFAMQAVVQGRMQTLDDQLYIFAKQAHKLYDAKDHFEWVVTDAPLFMMIYYIRESNKKFHDITKFDVAFSWKTKLIELIDATYKMYDNTVYFVNRGDREFRQLGRIHNQEQSIVIDKEIKEIIQSFKIDYTEINDLDQVIADLSENGLI